jgi:peptidyl-prolyl cis-trans isomerase SurA
MKNWTIATRFALGIAISLLATQSVWAQQDVVLDRIVAVVNEGIVLESEVTAETAFIASESRASGVELPEPSVLRERIIERLIDQTIQRQEAARLGIVADPSSVNRSLAEIARGNNMNTQQFREALLQQGFDYNHFRGSIEQQIITERLVQREVQARVRVSEQEIDDYLLAAQTNAQNQARYRLQHMLIAVPASASASVIEQANAKADKILSELRAGGDFATIAAAQSDGSRALQGGDLGWRERQELPAFIDTALDTMKTNDIRGPLRSPNGLHIIRLADKQIGSGPAQQETLIRHIFIAGNESSVQAQLTQARNRIVSGTDFASVAAEISEDPNSANVGGELPWFSRGQLPPALEQAADQLTPGVVSQPFQTQYGWHIVEVLDRRERTITSESARIEAENALRQRRVEQAAERWIRQLRDESFVELRSE